MRSALYVAADQILEEVVAVEPAPSLPQLRDPRPYLVGRGANGDGAGCGEAGVRDQAIAGEGLIGLLAGRAPPEMPGPRKENVRGRCASNGDDAGVSAFHAVAPFRSSSSADATLPRQWTKRPLSRSHPIAGDLVWSVPHPRHAQPDRCADCARGYARDRCSSRLRDGSLPAPARLTAAFAEGGERRGHD